MESIQPILYNITRTRRLTIGYWLERIKNAQNCNKGTFLWDDPDQDDNSSYLVKGESTACTDLSAPLMYHDPTSL